MLTVKLTRWLIGCVQFRVLGGSLERFLNQCARSGIYLWDIHGAPNCGASVAAGSYRDLHRCARRAGCRLRVVKRYGFPFATRGIRKRRGILAGSVLFVVVIMILSMHVWSIEIVGNRTIPTSEMEDALHSMGVDIGTMKKNIDPHKLQQALMLKFPKISWLSVNTRGCTAEIHLQEKIDKPPIAPPKKVDPCNIRAGVTGQILSMEVYIGTPQVKEGDAVVEGQLLISGVVEDSLGYTTLKRASGKIMAETTRSFTTEVELKRSENRPTGRVVTQRSLNFLSARFPLSFTTKPEGHYRPERSMTKLRLMNAVLPLGIYEENWVEEHTVNYTLTKSQGLKEAEQQISQQEKKEMRNFKILSTGFSDRLEGTRLICTATVKAQEDIARESQIIINSN